MKKKEKKSNSVIGEVLRKYRNYHGLSRPKLAEKIGVSFKTIESYELGINFPPHETLKLLQKTLDIPIAELFSDMIPTKGYIANTEEKLFKYHVVEILEKNPDLLEFVRKYGKNSAEFKKDKLLKLVEKLIKIPPKKRKSKFDLISKLIRTE